MEIFRKIDQVFFELSKNKIFWYGSALVMGAMSGAFPAYIILRAKGWI